MVFKQKFTIEPLNSSKPRLVGLELSDSNGSLQYRVGFIVFNSHYSHEKSNEALLSQIKRAISQEYDLVICPEYAFSADDGNPMSKNIKDELVEIIRKESINSPSLVVPGTFLWEDDNCVYNQVIAFHDERTEQYSKIHKQARDTRGFFGGKPNKPGYVDKSPLVIEWRGLRTGIEICADYGSLNIEHGEQELDLHILVACMYQDIPSSLTPRGLKEGGVLLFNDGMSTHPCAGVNLTSGGIIDPFEKEPFKQWRKIYYDLEGSSIRTAIETRVY